jgi:amino acid permease
MKYLMAFFFALIPALVVGGGAYLLGAGPWAALFGWAVWGLGMDVCLNGSDRA